MEERIVAPDPVTEPEAYQQALLALLGGLDPVEVLAATPIEFAQATAALDDAALTRAPEPGEWSVEELLAHFFNGEVVAGFRWRLTLGQPDSAYPGYDQDAWTTLARPPFGDLLEAFTALRRANVALVEGTPRSEWSKVGHHSERGPESFELAVQLIAGHDLAHLKQLEQTIAAITQGPSSPLGFTSLS